MKLWKRGKKAAALFAACSVMFAEPSVCSGISQVHAATRNQIPEKAAVQMHINAKKRASAKAGSTAQGISVAYHSKEDIRKYIRENGATLSDPLEFASAPVPQVPFQPGRLSDKTQQAALNMLKQIRYIAGISDTVEIKDSMCQSAQAAALVNYVNGKLDHYPDKPQGMDDSLFQAGYAGAQSCNIAWASWGGRSLNETIALSWMKDADTGNIKSVGHRRWLLNPQMGKTGFGAVSGSNGTYSSVYAMDTSNSSAAEKGVAWPAQNMPAEYFSANFPWSISMGHAVDKSRIQVKLTRLSDNRTWNFSESSSDGDFYVNNDRLGQQGCIIFRPELSEIQGYQDGDSYQVTITGDTRPVSYTVHFFNLITLESISAEYKGGPVEEGGTVKKADILVNGTYSDGTVRKITDFTILPYEIKAGNNEITIQYEDKTASVSVTGTVKKITVRFDAAGGSSVSPCTIEKGTVLKDIPETSRKGYIFEGWYTAQTGGTKLEKTTVLDKDVTYYAHWKAVELSHITAEYKGPRIIAGVGFEFETEDFLVTAFYTDGSSRAVSNYTMDDYEITARENALTIHYGGKSVVVKVYAEWVEEFSAMYVGGRKLAGTTELEYQDLRLYVKISDGDTIIVKEGFTIDPFVIQAGENTLTVHFGGKSRSFQVPGYEEESTAELTGITVSYTGGSVEAGSRVDRTMLEVKARYSDGSEKAVSNYTIVDDVIREGENTITVTYQGKTASFQVTGTAPQVQMVTVRFQAKGGSEPAKGTAVGTLPETAREGYTFDGWYTRPEGGVRVTPETLVQEDVTYYARWTQKPDKPENPDETQKPDKPVNPDETQKPDKPSSPDGPGTEVPGGKVTITFDACGGGDTLPVSIAENGTLSYIPVTHKPGWVFQGWFTGVNGTGSMLTLGTVLREDITYYAYWTLADRTMTGIQVFVNGKPFEGENVRQRLMVRAVFSDGSSEPVYDYLVSQEYLSAGSSWITVTYRGYAKSIQVLAGTEMTQEGITGIRVFYSGGDVPAGTHTVFGGLTVKAVYSDGTEREVEGYTLSGNTIRKGSNTVMVHYAGRTAGFTVTGYEYSAIRVHADGVSDIWISQETDLNAALSSLFPVKAGYEFRGWYLDEGCTRKIGPETGAFDGMHVYAKWNRLFHWKLNKSRAAVKQGRTLRLYVEGSGSTKVTWKTSDKKVASVSKNGTVKGKKAGTAMISAVTADGSVMTCQVTVKKKAEK